MNYKRFLAKLRAWIDRRLPRDVLRITVLAHTSDGGVVLLYSNTHMDEILACKMRGGPTVHSYDDMIIQFSTEHLSV